MHQAALAERYCLDDPNAALIKLRLFGELLANNIAARLGVSTDLVSQQIEILKELKYRDVLDQKLSVMVHSLWIFLKTARVNWPFETERKIVQK